MVENITVANGGSQSAAFDFIKNTCTLKVKVAGLDILTRAPGPGQPLHLFVLGHNERYGYDDAVDPLSRQVRYEPPYASLTPTSMDVDVRLQRIDKAFLTIQPMLLYVQRPAAGTDVLPPLDVLQTILGARDGGGNPIWQSQEDIDREDEFTIELSVKSDLSVGVTVNGFEVETPTAELGR